MTGRNLCQINITADKKPRASKQLSIAKIKIARVIAYSMKPQGKKSLSVFSTSWSVLRWNMLNFAAQMQLDFIHKVPIQSRLKRLHWNIGPAHCSGEVQSNLMTSKKRAFIPKPGVSTMMNPVFCLSLLPYSISRLCSCSQNTAQLLGRQHWSPFLRLI